VKQGFESLSKSNSSLDESNVLSSAAGHLSRQQMPSEEELHSLQQYCPLTTKLRGSGADVRQALNADPRKKGRRFSQNNLVDMSRLVLILAGSLFYGTVTFRKFTSV